MTYYSPGSESRPVSRARPQSKLATARRRASFNSVHSLAYYRVLFLLITPKEIVRFRVSFSLSLVDALSITKHQLTSTDVGE